MRSAHDLSFELLLAGKTYLAITKLVGVRSANDSMVTGTSRLELAFERAVVNIRKTINALQCANPDHEHRLFSSSLHPVKC